MGWAKGLKAKQPWSLGRSQSWHRGAPGTPAHWLHRLLFNLAIGPMRNRQHLLHPRRPHTKRVSRKELRELYWVSARQGLCAQLRAGKHGPTRLTTAPGREAGGGRGGKSLNGAAVLCETTSTELTNSFPTMPAVPKHPHSTEAR